jgi:hypothetical protein
MRPEIQSREASETADGEHTEVRTRQVPEAARVTETLDAKLQRAREAFEQLADDDPRARLLQVAMLRRDDVLLEAILRRLEPGSPT